MGPSFSEDRTPTQRMNITDSRERIGPILVADSEGQDRFGFIRKVLGIITA